MLVAKRDELTKFKITSRRLGVIYILHTHTLSGIPSSSSSYRAGSTDIPDPLSPLLPIVHRPR